MPSFPGLSHHQRSHSHSNAASDAPTAFAQTISQLAGVGAPAAAVPANPAAAALAPSDSAPRGLRVQTNAPAVGSRSPNSGVTPIHSGSTAPSAGAAASAGGAGRAGAAAAADNSKKLSFRLPSPPHASAAPPSPSDIYQSPQELRHPQKPVQVYAPYQATVLPTRPQAQHTATAPGAVPVVQHPPARPSMHRTNTQALGQPAYSPNPAVEGTGGRKYTHPGALTPTYPSASQHSSSHSGSHLGMGLTGLASPAASSTGDDLIGGVGAVGKGRWMSPWCLYAVDWCKWPVSPGNGYGRVAVGSYAEDSHNYIQVLDTLASQNSSSPSPTIEFTKLAEASHTYPITRVLWEPPTSNKPLTDLLATSGDHLRLWSIPQSATASPSNSITSRPGYSAPPQKLTPLALLSNSKSTDFTAPLTSLDWNTVSPSLIITSSIDTTCTIWDIPTLTAKTQLIAHDKEVYDVRFMSNSVDVFASCGADGSVRMFDLRSLEHSTIIYEPGVGKTTSSAGSNREDHVGGDPHSGSPVNSGSSAPPPLLRLSASPHDQHLIATFAADSPVVRILDVRQPGQALIELKGHSAAVNCVEWNPGRRGILAAGGDDCEVLVWDIYAGSHSERNPSTSSSSGNPRSSVDKSAKTNGGSSSSSKPEGGEKDPAMWWASEVEVNNLSWSPPSSSGSKGGSDFLGVLGGRGITALAV